MRRASLVIALVAGGCGRWGFADRTPAGADATADGAGDGDVVAIDAADRPNRIFITSTMYPGDLGGLTGANQKCGDRAAAAGLGGTWVAVLYTLADDPSARLVGSRGWVDLHGLVIADEPASLVFATANPLRYDEHGTLIPTTTNGMPQAWWGGHPSASQTCQDWTTTATDMSGTHAIDGNASFDTDFYTSCASSNRLLCAETGHVAPSRPPIQTGRDAFVTVAKFTNTGGLGAADTLCQSEASTAGLPGTYRAYLATTTATADSRFDTAGLPWRRVDGVRITQTAAAMFGPSPQDPWDSWIAIHADGTRTVDRVTTGNAVDNCANWTSGTTTVSLRLGSSHATQRGRLTTFPATCNNVYPILCFAI